jgi:hypothetical protein
MILSRHSSFQIWHAIWPVSVLMLVALVEVTAGRLWLNPPAFPYLHWSLLYAGMLSVPVAFPIPALLAIGLLDDALRGTPPGFHAVLYLALSLVLQRVRGMVLARGFLAAWGMFALCVYPLMGCVSALPFWQMGLPGLVYGRLLPEWLLMAGVYPLAHGAVSRFLQGTRF